MSSIVLVWDGMILICEVLTSSAPRGREICENPTTTCHNQGKQLTLSNQFSVFLVSWIGYSPWAVNFQGCIPVSSSSIYVFSLWIRENRSTGIEFEYLVFPIASVETWAFCFFHKCSERCIIFQSNLCLSSAWDEQQQCMVCPIYVAKNIWKLLKVLHRPHIVVYVTNQDLCSDYFQIWQLLDSGNENIWATPQSLYWCYLLFHSTVSYWFANL